jgi:hypothetical protein
VSAGGGDPPPADAALPRPRSASTRTFQAATRANSAAPPQRSNSLVQRTSVVRTTEAPATRTTRASGQRAAPTSGGPRTNGPRSRDLPSRKTSFIILPYKSFSFN